jgi:hypothetical protein
MLAASRQDQGRQSCPTGIEPGTSRRMDALQFGDKNSIPILIEGMK